ncbi:protein Aster-C [Triplophysa dalaica]|uniref:protein Aster-C n=1 Tax=Triplophysa dalaica TaxID=1582913 RepID=UPI0024DF3CB1|nr:protein Aster-C [Triplophysa dalaica]XP_056595025.1 protein Aster-C [Triplophysa dalaica]
MTHTPKKTKGNELTQEHLSPPEVKWSAEEPEVLVVTGQCITTPQSPEMLLYTTYKQRTDEFRKLFKDVPEKLIADYTCAVQKDILLQGRLYLTENWLCFYSMVFRGTKITLNMKDITSMSREKTAKWIPNAIQITTNSEKLFFSSFSAREKSFLWIFRLWQNILLEKKLSKSELLHMVKQHYGNDLGLSYDDMERFQTAAESVTSTQPSLNMRGEDNNGRPERPTSLRLPLGELSPYEASTPQGDNTQSPIGLQNTLSVNGDDTLSPPSRQRSPNLSLNRSGSDRVSKRSSLSLDLNANEDQHSDNSRSESLEEVEERETPSPVSQGRLFVNKVFHISAEKMFELLFTDSNFVRRFMDIRKITGMTSTSWQKDSSDCMKRTLNYTITINNPLVGKFSTATEYQTLYKESREGQYYMVGAEVYTHDVPYHDYFYTQNRFCIISNSKHKCRLRIYTDVIYKKQPWGLVKSFISKNSWSGIEDYFKHLEAELLEEEAELIQGSGDAGKTGALRRRRRTYSRSLQEMKPGKQYSTDSEQQRGGTMGAVDMKNAQRWNITTIVIGMSLILFVLTALNLGLFFKLWAMEDVAHRMYLSTKHRMRERAESSLESDLGTRQGMPHRGREEVRLLRTVLQDSINLLEQLRSSLVMLQQNFQVYNRTSSQL